MPTQTDSEHLVKRIAVLIDADNVSEKIADALFDEIAKIGQASVKRIYGDFSTSHLHRWKSVIFKHALIPQMNYANTVGKNATDIALVIDAMDLLHSERFEAFCLVSSDSDFTRLASRIREQGVDVYGFGEQKTPESFRRACFKFIYTENLGPEIPEQVFDQVTATALSTKAKANTHSIAEAKPKVSPPVKKKPPSAAVPLLKKAFAQVNTNDEEWVNLSSVGNRLTNLEPDFDPRTYGHSNLSNLVEKCGAFAIQRVQGQGYVIRLNSPPKKSPAAKK